VSQVVVRGAEAAAASCSFSNDTLVATETGERPIDSIHVGDRVRAYAQATRATGWYSVAEVLVNDDPVVVHLEFDGYGVETTPEHPFSVEGRGWVLAGELRTGDQIHRESGATAIVRATTAERRARAMYNLTVDGAHTFFVGPEQLLVHNGCGPLSILDWSAYPAYLPRPAAPFTLLNTAEYRAARAAANAANRAIRDEAERIMPGSMADMQVHEIHPVIFGGDPVSLANKVILPNSIHAEYTTWWTRVQRRILR
jgi:filamentous hemagglutinin